MGRMLLKKVKIHILVAFLALQHENVKRNDLVERSYLGSKTSAQEFISSKASYFLKKSLRKSF